MISTAAPGVRIRGVRLVLMVLMVLGCTGCRLGLSVDVNLNRDGGGTLSVAVTADEQLQQQAEQAGVDPLGDLAATAARLRRSGWSVSDATHGESGVRTVALSTDFANADEFNVLARDLAEALAADEVVFLEDLRLDVTEEVLTLQGVAGAEPTPAVRDYGLRPARVVRLVQREDALAYRVRVTVPGQVLRTNGDSPRPQQVSWAVPAGKTVAFTVESARPGFPVVRAVAGAVLGGLVAAGVLWFVSRRRQASARSARIRDFSART